MSRPNLAQLQNNNNKKPECQGNGFYTLQESKGISISGIWSWLSSLAIRSSGGGAWGRESSITLVKVGVSAWIFQLNPVFLAFVGVISDRLLLRLDFMLDFHILSSLQRVLSSVEMHTKGSVS